VNRPKCAVGQFKIGLGFAALAGGFALVAYPEHWDQSGIISFLVAHDGGVFERNLGVKTSRIAGAMTEYYPDSECTPLQDEGGLSAVSEN